MATEPEPDEQNGEQNREDQNGDKKQARHNTFIGTLLLKTARIQREMRGRAGRYKVCVRMCIDN
jgi:hypothetical protein